MTQVFISYSHGDKKYMTRLREICVNAGFNVWTDEQLRPGTPSWLRAIQQQIEIADSLVVILSPSAKNSEWVDRELFYAHLQDVPIVPILAIGTLQNAVPFLLSTAQLIDMRSQADWASGIGQLVKTLQNAPSKGTIAKPSKENLHQYIALADSNVNQLLKSMHEMIEETQLLGSKSALQIPSFLLAKQNNDTERIASTLKVVSEYLMDFSDAVEKQLPSFQQIWIGLLENMSSILSVLPLETDKDEKDYIYLRASLETARQGFETGAIPGLHSFQAILSKLEHQSIDLQRAVKLISPVVSDLEISMQVGVTYFGLLLDAVNTGINEFETHKT